MIALRVRARFAAYRGFTAGSFRPSAAFMPPSAAYGLLLNLAGIEMREDDGKSVATTIRPGLPSLTLALGAVAMPDRGSVFQQLHNYPIGATGKENAERCHGRKYNVTPVRRELLIGLDALVAAKDGADGVLDAVCDGLERGRPGYGLPFCGDNNLLPDRIDLVDPAALPTVTWFTPIIGEEDDGMRPCVTRLTVTIDRLDMTRTTTLLMGPAGRPSSSIPDQAWVRVAYP